MSENENDFNQQPSDMWQPPAAAATGAHGVGSPAPGPASAASASSENPAANAGSAPPPGTPSPAAQQPTTPHQPMAQQPTTPQQPMAQQAEPTMPTTQIPAHGPYVAAASLPHGAPGSGPAAGGPGPGTWTTETYPGYPATGYAGPPRTRKYGVGKVVAGGVLALALAGGGGLVGALVTHNLDKTGTVTGTSTTVVSNAPIIDRSSLASIASAVRPSVVSITTASAEGSGVVLSKDGYILTNNHVAVTAQGGTVNITFSDGKTVRASLVGTDPKTDLAVFKAQGVSNLTVAKFGDSSALQVGDTVLAIGSPLGLDGSVTSGIVSALNRTIDETSDSQPQNPFQQNPGNQPTGTTIAGAIQTDAAINPGNSGGALVNTNGEVVGINTAIATSGSGSEGNIGVGFAIPSNKAKQVAEDLIAGKSVSHPQLGVEVTTAPNNAGALVHSVSPGTAADKAGVKAGDVITGFDGTAVHTSEDLINDVQGSEVNKQVTLTVNRNGQSINLTATLLESK